MTIGGETCYAGSLTKVILLAGSKHEEKSVTFSGDARPIADLRLLFDSGLGENEPLPEPLAYLN